MPRPSRLRAVHTVKSHVHNKLEKLALHTRLELAHHALKGDEQTNLPRTVLPDSKFYTEGTITFSILRASISRTAHT